MKLSANLGFLWPERPLLERIDAAAAAGFHAIELHWPYHVPASHVRHAVDRNGLIVLGLNTPIDAEKREFGLGAVAGRQDDFRRGFLEAASYARVIGARSIHVMAGDVPAGRTDEAQDLFAENLTWATGQASDLTLLLEPINHRDRPNYFYSRSGEAAALIERVGSPNIRLMFDFYHIGISEGPPIEKMARHLPIIGHVQIAAVPSRAEPNEGVLDYRAIFKELDMLGYTGWIGCEYRPRADTGTGLRWMEAFGVEFSA